MNTELHFLIAGTILAIAAMVITGVIVISLYALSVWAIRTAKSPAERKDQTKVAKRVVLAAPLRGLINLTGSRERRAE
jgi:cytochrome bd-type quinol oxidase subunit 1